MFRFALINKLSNLNQWRAQLESCERKEYLKTLQQIFKTTSRPNLKWETKDFGDTETIYEFFRIQKE